MMRILGKILSLGDFLCIIAFLLVSYLPARILSYAAGYLIIKGAIFLSMGNKVSVLDILCGIYMVFIIFGFSNHFLTAFFILFLAQKTILMFIL